MHNIVWLRFFFSSRRLLFEFKCSNNVPILVNILRGQSRAVWSVANQQITLKKLTKLWCTFCCSMCFVSLDGLFFSIRLSISQFSGYFVCCAASIVTNVLVSKRHRSIISFIVVCHSEPMSSLYIWPYYSA